MNFQITTNEKICPREEISLYLDGELSPQEETNLENHFNECDVCFSEFNLQKKMLTALNFAFDKNDEIKLPKDFTKIVVTKAESGVCGLRSKEERFRALFLFSGLILFFVIGFGAESNKIFSSLNAIGNQVIALVGFFLRLTFDISFGLAVILRSLSQKVILSSVFTFLIITVFVSVLLLLIPRFADRLSRAKTS